MTNIKYVIILLFFFIPRLFHCQYQEKGKEFKSNLVVGSVRTYLISLADVNAKFIDRNGNNYTFEFDSTFIKSRGLANESTSESKEYWKHIYNVIKREIPTAPYQDDSTNYIRDYRENIEMFKQQVSKNRLTFYIPTFTKPIPLDKDSTYSLTAEYRGDCPDSYQFYIFQKGILYFAGASMWELHGIIFPKNYPLEIKHERFLLDNYSQDDCYFRLNQLVKYSYKNEYYILNQGDVKKIKDWTIYQGISQGIIRIAAFMDGCENCISFTIVKNN